MKRASIKDGEILISEVIPLTDEMRVVVEAAFYAGYELCEANVNWTNECIDSNIDYAFEVWMGWRGHEPT